MGVLWQAGKMMISRKTAPLVDVFSGLVRYSAVSIAGLVFWQTVIQLGDGATSYIVAATKQDFGTQLGLDISALVAPVAAGTAGGAVIPVLVLGLVVLICSLVQWVLAFVRLAGIQVLAVLLPLAAAGSLTESTRPWLRKVNSWMLALVAYKPMAAIIYLIGFGLLVGRLPDGTPPDMQPLSRTVVGAMVLVLAIFLLPVMMKFVGVFGADTSGAGVAGTVLGAGAVAVGAVKLTGMMSSGAVAAADRMQTTGPASGPPPTAGPEALPPGGSSWAGPPPTGPQPGGPGGPGPAAPPGGPDPSRPATGPTPSPGPTGAPPGPAPGAVPAGAGAQAGAGAGATAGTAGTAAAGAGAAGGPVGVAAGAAAGVVAAGAQQAKGQPGQFGGQPPSADYGGGSK
jgi:hypothetical protein